MNKTALCNRLLEVIEYDIIPKTRAGVAAGNKVFGAAILQKSDLSLVVAETNGETKDGVTPPAMRPLFRRRQRHV